MKRSRWRESEDHAAYRDLPKYVASTTLAEDDLFDGWGETRILRSMEDVAAPRGQQLTLRDSAAYANGVVKVVYDVNH